MSDRMALDGNAIAGLLRELFDHEMTDVMRACASCGERHPIGAHMLYRSAGAVLRCPACDDLAMLVVTLPDRTLVQLTGTWTLSLASS
jgi:Family of unknown function (DUF6510)